MNLKDFYDFLNINWIEILIISLFSTLFIILLSFVFYKISNFFRSLLPLNLLLSPFNKNKEKCFIVIPKFSRFDQKMSSSLAYLISLLGKAGKTENLKIVEDSEPFRHWDENLIIFDNRYANGYTTSKILEVYRKTFYKKNNGHLISVDGDFDELIWTCFIQKISNKNNKKKKILLIIDNLHRNGVVFGGYILNVYNKFFIEKFGNKDFACVFGGEGDIDLEVLSFKSKTNFLERIGFWIIGLFVKGPTLSKVS